MKIDWKQIIVYSNRWNVIEKKNLISKQSIEIGNIFHLEMFRISFLINSKSLNPAYVSNPNDFFKCLQPNYTVSKLRFFVSNLSWMFPMNFFCSNRLSLFSIDFYVINWHCFQTAYFHIIEKGWKTYLVKVFLLYRINKNYQLLHVVDQDPILLGRLLLLPMIQFHNPNQQF